MDDTVGREVRLLVLLICSLLLFAAGLGLYVRGLARLGTTLDRMERAAQVVADNLAASVERANAATGPDGAAADAALRTEDLSRPDS